MSGSNSNGDHDNSLLGLDESEYPMDAELFTPADFVRYMTALNAAWVREFGRVFAARPELVPKKGINDISAEDAVATMQEMAAEVLAETGLVAGPRAKALGERLKEEGDKILRGDVPMVRYRHQDGQPRRTDRVVGGQPT